MPGSTATSITSAMSSRSPGARRWRSSTFAPSARSTRTRSPRFCAPRTSTSPRAATIRARTRSSRRSRADFQRPTARAAATPSSSARAACRFARTRSWTASSSDSSSTRRAACGDLDPPDLVGRRPLPRGSRPGRRDLESRDRGELPATRRARRQLPRRQAARSRRVSRAHDVLYLSDAWTVATWLGAQALKNPLNLWVYQEIMVETRPEPSSRPAATVAGARFPRLICDLLGVGEVVSIDIEPVRETTRRTRGSPTWAGAPRPTPTSSQTFAAAPKACGRSSSWTPTTRSHTSRPSSPSMRHRARRLYVIVEDSNIGEIRKDLLPGPLEAIEAFLAGTDEFVIDRGREKSLITWKPSGYLRGVW